MEIKKMGIKKKGRSNLTTPEIEAQLFAQLKGSATHLDLSNYRQAPACLKNT